MSTPFRTERMFHDTHGWYASLRPDDAAFVRQMYVPGRRLVDNVGLVVGPFPRRDRLEAWLEKFIDLHGTSRIADRLERAA